MSKLLRRVQLFAVEVMVDLKAPDAIYVMSHNDCGAAKAIGFSDSAVKQAHAAFGKTLQEKFPNIPVYVMHELHSMCGEHHHGHETIVDAA